MKRQLFSVIAVCLVLCLVLSCCAGLNFSDYFQQLGALLGGGMLTPFDQMEYVRPDMAQFALTLDDCCARGEREIVLPNMVEVIYDFYGAYDDFYTAYALAMIHYSQDQTDTYWQAEYQFCTENSATVDAALDRFYRVLAKSPLRQQLEGEEYFGTDFFVRYEGASLYDEYFTDLLCRETVLENQYYDLIAQAGADFGNTEAFYDAYGWQMAQIFVELIGLRQAQADYAGYDSYPEFAYDFYYVRDYTVAQANGYLADIRADLVPLYSQVLEETDVVLYRCTDADMLRYISTMAQAMGGGIYEAFTAMERAGVYDITANANKLDASFEIYIRNYATPFLFLNPTGTELDMLAFAHEFGHFCNDYMSMGSGVGVDVAEIFSQGMEYLSLFYGPADDNLTRLKLLEGLCIYVEQAAYASFEQQVYALRDEALTVENVQALYDQVSRHYGLEGGNGYVFIAHFFTQPMYVISYVVSNDAALQLFQMEQETTGSGLACLRENLAGNQPYFLAFVQQAGLESPFATGRTQRVKETLQSILNG